MFGTPAGRPQEKSGSAPCGVREDGMERINIGHVQTKPKQGELSQDELMKRPAPSQVKDRKGPRHDDNLGNATGMYNIWYHKRPGDESDYGNKSFGTGRGARNQEFGKYRCRVQLDTGHTSANEGDDPTICLFFAKGMCNKGANCTHLHRIPNEEDEKNVGEMHDVFGRERFGEHRDDMGGVGTFGRETKTIYVGNIPKPKKGQQTWDTIQLMVHDCFSEFGPIDFINVIPRLGIAFVRYQWRVSAEFGKLAMGDQSMDAKQLLNVRWAYEDPNPKAQERDQHQRLLKMYRAVERQEKFEREQQEEANRIWEERRKASAQAAANAAALDLPSAGTQMIQNTAPPPVAPAKKSFSGGPQLRGRAKTAQHLAQHQPTVFAGPSPTIGPAGPAVQQAAAAPRKRQAPLSARAAPTAKKAKKSEALFFYKDEQSQTHGPYPQSSILTWHAQGYFNDKTLVKQTTGDVFQAIKRSGLLKQLKSQQQESQSSSSASSGKQEDEKEVNAEAAAAEAANELEMMASMYQQQNPKKAKENSISATAVAQQVSGYQFPSMSKFQ